MGTHFLGNGRFEIDISSGDNMDQSLGHSDSGSMQGVEPSVAEDASSRPEKGSSLLLGSLKSLPTWVIVLAIAVLLLIFFTCGSCAAGIGTIASDQDDLEPAESVTGEPAAESPVEAEEPGPEVTEQADEPTEEPGEERSWIPIAAVMAQAKDDPSKTYIDELGYEWPAAGVAAERSDSFTLAEPTTLRVTVQATSLNTEDMDDPSFIACVWFDAHEPALVTWPWMPSEEKIAADEESSIGHDYMKVSDYANGASHRIEDEFTVDLVAGTYRLYAHAYDAESISVTAMVQKE